MSSLEQFSDSLWRHTYYIRDAILARLPEDRNSRILLAGGTLSVAGVVLFPVLHHTILGRRVTHTHPNASSRLAALECGEIDSLPKDVVENSKQYRIVHDKVVKTIPDLTIMLSEDLRANFNRMLRYNMTRFSNTPQAWALWFANNSPQQRETFTKEHIDGLNFIEGDILGGSYEVVKRTPLRVEIAIRPPPSLNQVSGLLIISLRPRNQGAVLLTETIQWADREAGVVLPLERWYIRFLHDYTSRWLAITGAAYLQSISNAE